MPEIILIALSLSMDAFCISVTNGLTVRSFGLKQALLMGAYFGGFQFLMPLVGAFLAGTVSSHVEFLGPYISFTLLTFIGVRMIRESIGNGSVGSGSGVITLSHTRLLAMAVATSIDALAVGVSFAFMNIRLIPACILIGAITFAVCVAGGFLGKYFPMRSAKAAGILGGAVLVAIGVKLLVEGVFF